MLLVTFLALLVATVPLAGGRLSALAEVRFRWRWTLVYALGLQGFVMLLRDSAPPEMLGGIHVASYLLAGLFLVTNWAVPGVWVIALGGAMNLTAIAANGGVMPADPRALAAARLLEAPRGFANSAPLPDPNLSFLGDVFAIPPPFPLHNVFSPGDVVIALGLAVALHRLCGSRLASPRERRFAELLAHGDFVRLWVAQGVSNLGDWVYALAVATSVAHRHGAAGILAVLMIAEVAPAAVAGMLGGPLVDRLSRKRLMVGADLARAAAVASLLPLAPPSVPHLYGVAVILGLLRAMSQPSLHASIPNVVPRDRIVAANALVSATYHTAVMAGPVAGGILVAAVGPPAAFALNATTFALSALLIAGVRLPPRAAASEAGSHVRLLVDGFRYTLGTPLVRAVLLVTGLVMVAAAIRSPLEPVFVVNDLGGGPAALGLVGGAWGLGMLLGSLAAPSLAARWPRERLLSASVALVGACVLVASRAQGVPGLLLPWVVGGACNALGTVSYESLLQERTPDAVRGRVLAASEAVLDLGFLGGLALAAGISGGLGIRPTFVLSGVMFVATAAAGWRLLRPPSARGVSGPALGFPDPGLPAVPTVPRVPGQGPGGHGNGELRERGARRPRRTS